jgi:copper oxidase (laccase) domain-containing protein
MLGLRALRTTVFANSIHTQFGRHYVSKPKPKLVTESKKDEKKSATKSPKNVEDIKSNLKDRPKKVEKEPEVITETSEPKSKKVLAHQIVL